jgi:copper homeostasis protein
MRLRRVVARAPTAEEGLPVLASLARQAGGRIGILPGAGVGEENIARILAATGAVEAHVRGTSLRPSAMEYRNPGIDFGGRVAAESDAREVTDPARIERILQAAR